MASARLETRGRARSAFLLIAATDSREVNRQIAKTASSNQLVNVIDAPELGNFHVPASLHRGRLTIAVSTGGASPLMARKIRDAAGEILGDDIEQYLDFLFRFREKLKVKNLDSSQKKLCLKKLLEPGYKKKECQELVLADVDAFIERCLHSNSNK
ncbi:NAD(P)-dependent oxidoreductase [Terrilactibacillus sp. S3-3]|nr:NAD(P)-dependent oxidoreductase [Terrilactibacillus sp. S3-3]